MTGAVMMEELPAEGFPVSAEPVRRWFMHRYRREPGAVELARVLNAMAAREATPPIEDTAACEPGWRVMPDGRMR
jgi:hypothetical protein